VRAREPTREPQGDRHDQAATDTYQASDLFVFASLTDTQGIVVLEALASGLGVVALRDAAFTDMVISGTTGLLVNPKASPQVFAKRILTALDNPQLRRDSARSGVQTAGHFTEHQQARKLLRIYQELVSAFR
jgi:1,2-diacylglycerol 3-alpha-glucosyltransferase